MTDVNKYDTDKLMDEVRPPIVEELTAETLQQAEKVTAKYEIPIDGFSDTVQGIIRYFSNVTGTCTNFAIMNILTALGGAAGLRLKCIDGDYVNYGQLYTCLYGDMSVGKSPSFKPVMAPLQQRNSLYISTWNKEMKDWKSSKKNGGDMPRNKQFILNSSTPESLDQIHDDNRNGVFIFIDELQDFFDNINAYNKGNIVGKLNTAYINQTIIVNRKSSDYIINIPTSFYAILGSLQPLVVKQYFGKHLNGLFQRFCFVLPNSVPLARCESNESMVNAWARIAWAVLDMPEFALTFDKEAKCLLREWQSQLQECVLEMKDTEPILAGAYQKTSFFVRRIAAIVHLISKGTDITNNYTLYQEITRDEVDFAMRIVDVLKEGTKKVLSDIRGENVSGKGMTNEEFIYELTQRFEISSVAELARVIGKQRPWVSRSINKYKKDV